MIQAQQVGVQRIQPGQVAVQPGQVAVSPYATTAPAQFDISTLLASIMPLIMLVLMFQMLKPLLKGMATES